MTSTVTREVCAILAVTLAACGSKADKQATPQLPDELARWMPHDASAVWQGPWVTGLTFDLGRDSGTTALQIDGDKAVVFDGTRERNMSFAVIAPCVAEFVEAQPEDTRGSVVVTGTVSREVEFVLAGGKLEVGRGWLGYVQGKAAIACRNSSANGAIYTIDAAGHCERWEQWPRTAPWRHEEARCAWQTRDGHDVLAIEHGVALVADGNILRGEQTGMLQQTRAASFAAAKAALAK
jgi:hypothetical protein